MEQRYQIKKLIMFLLFFLLMTDLTRIWLDTQQQPAAYHLSTERQYIANRDKTPDGQQSGWKI